MGNTASTSNSSSSASHHQSTSAVKLTSTPILDRVSHGPDVSIEQFRSLTPGLSNQCTKTLFKLLSASSANTTSLKSTLQSGVRLMTDGFGTSLDNLDQDEIIWKRMMEPSTNDEIRVNLINDVLDLHKEAFIQLYATNTFNFIHQKTLDYISIPVTLDSLLRWQKQQYSNLFLIISLYIERHFNSSKQSFKCIASYPQIQYEIILYTPFNRHFDLLYQASENGYAISSFEHKVMRYASSTLTLFTCIDSGSIEYTFCLFLPNQWKKECWMDDPDTVFFKSGSGIRMTVKGLPFKNSNRLVKWGVDEGGWIGVDGYSRLGTRFKTDLRTGMYEWIHKLEDFDRKGLNFGWPKEEHSLRFEVIDVHVFGLGGCNVMESYLRAVKFEEDEAEKRMGVMGAANGIEGMYEMNKLILDLAGITGSND